MLANTTVTTAYQILQLQASTGVAFTVRSNTTLNYQYDVLPAEQPSAPPRLQYFGIGSNGFYNTDGTTGSAVIFPKATNLNLHDPIPLVIRPLASDLSSEEKANYRMREIRNIGGTDYAIYWLGKITYEFNRVDLTRISPDKNKSAYALDSNNLTPVPSYNEVSDVIMQDQIVASVVAKTTYSRDEVLNAINILGGDVSRRSVISEVGWYTGVDKEVVIDEQPAMEAIYTQLGIHRCSRGIALSEMGEEIESTITLQSGQLALI